MCIFLFLYLKTTVNFESAEKGFHFAIRAYYIYSLLLLLLFNICCVLSFKLVRRKGIFCSHFYHAYLKKKWLFACMRAKVFVCTLRHFTFYIS